MATTTAAETFYEITGNQLSSTSFLKMLPVLQDHTKLNFLNIWRSINIDDVVAGSVLYYDLYDVGNNDWLDNISNSYYGTPYLWWVICLMNGVSNPFECLRPGTQLKILKEEYLYQLFKEMRAIYLL